MSIGAVILEHKGPWFDYVIILQATDTDAYLLEQLFIQRRALSAYSNCGIKVKGCMASSLLNSCNELSVFKMTLFIHDYHVFITFGNVVMNLIEVGISKSLYNTIYGKMNLGWLFLLERDQNKHIKWNSHYCHYLVQSLTKRRSCNWPKSGSRQSDVRYWSVKSVTN